MLCSAEDAQELRKVLKSMEDKNAMYVQQNLDLEEVRCRASCDGHVILYVCYYIGAEADGLSENTS